MDSSLRDRRAIVAVLVWGSELERDADRVARELTPGLNARDVLLLASLAFDRNGFALPGDLIGPVHTTAAGVTGSIKRLSASGLVDRDVGEDARTKPVILTEVGARLLERIVDPWQSWFEKMLENLDDRERSDLYRLLVKASGTWEGVWPTEFENQSAEITDTD